MACLSLLLILCTLLVSDNKGLVTYPLTFTRICRILWSVFDFRELRRAVRQHRWTCRPIWFSAILREPSYVFRS